VITVDTPLALTDAGKDAATVSGLQKFFGEAKAFNKKELRFCGLERPVTDTAWTADTEGFSAVARELLQGRSVSYPLFEMIDEGREQLTLTIHHPAHDLHSDEEPDGESDGAEENRAAYAPYFAAEDPDAAATVNAVSVTGTAEEIMQSASQLLETAQALLTAPHP